MMEGTLMFVTDLLGLWGVDALGCGVNTHVSTHSRSSGLIPLSRVLCVFMRPGILKKCGIQADIWDVDGTGMQTVPDVEAARKMRKVRLSSNIHYQLSISSAI